MGDSCYNSCTPPSYQSQRTAITGSSTYFTTPTLSSSSSSITGVGSTSNHQPTLTSPSSSTAGVNSFASASTSSFAATTTTSSRPNALAAASPSHAGAIAGGVVGGVVFLALVALGILLYLRARKRKRIAPSSEFINSIRQGTAPVLRLDSGAEYTPALGEKSAGYTPYPPNMAFIQNAYYTSPPTKFPDETMSDPPSARPSFDNPLQPQRYSALRPPSDAGHYVSSSVGSRREQWGSDSEVISESPARPSLLHTDSVLQFAPRFSLLEDSFPPPSSSPSHSPPSLHPLRRQQ